MGQSSTMGRHWANSSMRPGCLSTLRLSCSTRGWKKGYGYLNRSKSKRDKLWDEMENALIVLLFSLILQYLFQQEMFLGS